MSPIKSLFSNINLDKDGTGYESTLVKRHPNDSEVLDLDAKFGKSGIEEVKTLHSNEPTILHTKKFRIGSGNIIGKGVIQDFFTCGGALPSMGDSILHRTSSLADVIALLIVELERQFMHMHPCIQKIFLEFSNNEKFFC